MKKFTLSLIMFISVFYSYSQSGTYLVALKYKVCGSPLTNTFSAIITDPAGNTTLQVLPDAINDDLNYGTQLNQIFSNITIQGFLVKTEVIHPSIITDLNGCVSDYRQYLFAPCCAP